MKNKQVIDDFVNSWGKPIDVGSFDELPKDAGDRAKFAYINNKLSYVWNPLDKIWYKYSIPVVKTQYQLSEENEKLTKFLKKVADSDSLHASEAQELLKEMNENIRINL